MMDILGRQPPKMSLTNVLNPVDTIFPQYNPETFEEELRAQWDRAIIPGLSHQRLQYVSSENNRFTFTLMYDATGRSEEERDLFEDHRRFISAHMHPRAGADSILGGEAPRLLFIWPGLISLNAILENARFRYKRFNSELALMAWEVSLELAEIRDVRLTFEEVRAQGTLRSGSPSSAVHAMLDQAISNIHTH